MDGYLIPDQFLDHLTVMKNYVSVHVWWGIVIRVVDGIASIYSRLFWGRGEEGAGIGVRGNS